MRTNLLESLVPSVQRAQINKEPTFTLPTGDLAWLLDYVYDLQDEVTELEAENEGLVRQVEGG